MKSFLVFVSVIFALFLFFIFNPFETKTSASNDIYQYVQACKTELGITRKLPRISCLDGKKIPIYVDEQEIQGHNWHEMSKAKKCDNPHWLGGDMGCWTYSHLQVVQIDDDNIMVVNCRQKGSQNDKNWYRKTKSNLGFNQEQRKNLFENAASANSKELYYLYNTFNDLGIILRNTKTGKSCYLTQYGEPFAGFLPPLDEPLPAKANFFKGINPKHARPPKDFPEKLWYRDANQAFRSPAFTASAGCIDCHNAHGFKYSPYINSQHGLPDIYSMAGLPMLLVGDPYIEHFRSMNILQLTTEPIDGEEQLCTSCHKITTAGTCGYLMDLMTGHLNMTAIKWTTNKPKINWMPPGNVDPAVIKKHVKALQCCCKYPNAKGCKTRKFGPTPEDVPARFSEGGGWVKSEGPRKCL
jgi:hypothetical protein